MVVPPDMESVPTQPMYPFMKSAVLPVLERDLQIFSLWHGISGCCIIMFTVITSSIHNQRAMFAVVPP